MLVLFCVRTAKRPRTDTGRPQVADAVVFSMVGVFDVGLVGATGPSAPVTNNILEEGPSPAVQVAGYADVAVDRPPTRLATLGLVRRGGRPGRAPVDVARTAKGETVLPRLDTATVAVRTTPVLRPPAPALPTDISLGRRLLPRDGAPSHGLTAEAVPPVTGVAASPVPHDTLVATALLAVVLARPANLIESFVVTGHGKTYHVP